MPAGLVWMPYHFGGWWMGEDQRPNYPAGAAPIVLGEAVNTGWTYGYESWRVEPGPPLPYFLLGLRARVAPLASVDAEALAEVLVTHYPTGAGIGWHRDAPAFGVVIGVSLLGTCRFRFQHGCGAARRTRTVTLGPRSAYVLDGAARWQWQHAIPPGRMERYSITFRTLRRNDRSP